MIQNIMLFPLHPTLDVPPPTTTAMPWYTSDSEVSIAALATGVIADSPVDTPLDTGNGKNF